MLTPTFVESSERVKARKEKEEEEELARVLAWEQKQIRELQERRERMRRERKAEIERVMRERAEERKRMEAARAERRQRRLLEEQKKQQEERMEKERQAKLAAELEQQKQKEIERLREENRRQILKREEERRMWHSLSKRRRQELMARFGSQARSEGSNEKLSRSIEYESYETNDRQENDLNLSAGNEEQDTWKTNGSQPPEPEPEDTEEKAEAVNQPHMMNSTTTGISTGFTPTVYTVYNSPSGTDPVVVQPVLTPNSGEQQISGSNTGLNTHQVNGQTTEDEYLRAYYEQYYKEWYRQHNEAARTTPAPVVAVTEAVVPRRQIQIKMGTQWGTPEASSPQTTVQSAQPLMPSPLINIPTPAAGATLSREQLDKICGEIQKTSRSFGINNPKTFALNNCPLVQMYYKHVSRPYSLLLSIKKVRVELKLS
ncbi:hypothetical protein TELCIR_03167 [Teladorsagia circumcincta]|uniref:aECM cysteine-cradle domain-containing protein n=1 Tax=Teladorsagia circumcincta TaxID=45464 RepID=A0A2G9UYK6_TELCI|nr:hypothetical protein TELCIR_03167 [Teladorsagia circumcincta]